MQPSSLVIRNANILTMDPEQPRAAVNHSNPAERIDVQEALAPHTINAARIGFTESDRGSLEAGKLGDFVVLTEDPFQVEPERIKDIPVEMTVLGGKVVYRH